MSRSMLATVYGQSKTGKTTFATSGDGAILLDLEDGAFAVRDDVQVIPIDSWQSLDTSLKNVIKSKPKVLALDSLTVAYDYALRHITQRPTNNDLLAVRNGPTLQQFGQANEMIKQLVLLLRSQPFDVICTAQERVQYVDNPGSELDSEVVSKESVIDLPNGARSFVVMYSDILGYTQAAQLDGESGVNYRLWLKPTPGITVGMRGSSTAKKPYLTNPTYNRLYKYIGINK